VPWRVHRIAVSGRYTDPLHTLLTEWSLGDVLDANEMLDALEDAQAAAAQSEEG
jgi:hypothetical protein